MTSYKMPEVKEIVDQTQKEIANAVLLQLLNEQLDYIEEDIMEAEDLSKLQQFRDWANEYIDRLIDKQGTEKRDLVTLVAKACLYDQGISREEWMKRCEEKEVSE